MASGQCEICGEPGKAQTVDGLRGIFCAPCAKRMGKAVPTKPLLVSARSLEADFRG